jgi:hypothetical protein
VGLSRIVDPGEGIGFVGLYVHHDPFAEQHPDPDAKPDSQCHPQGVDLPVASVDPAQVVPIVDDVRRTSYWETVFASEIANHSRVLAHSPDLVGVRWRQKLDPPFVHDQPHLDLLEFTRFLVGAEPLGVAFQSALQFWSHYGETILSQQC